MIEIDEVLAALAMHRPLFHSEADFQHAFAWEVHRRLPTASVRLELPVQVEDKFLHIDVWVVGQAEVLAVELKYKTRRLSVHIGDEQYKLKSQSAQDIGRYDFIKDIQRLEGVATTHNRFTGFAILLTNDSTYWMKRENHETVDAAFRIHNGQILEGVFDWGVHASEGTKKNREQSLVLQNRYRLNWMDYSRPSLASYGTFRSLAVKVVQDTRVS